jgi:hypothetical protein
MKSFALRLCTVASTPFTKWQLLFSDKVFVILSILAIAILTPFAVIGGFSEGSEQEAARAQAKELVGARNGPSR